MRDDGTAGIATPFDAHLHVPALELKLGDILFYQEIDKLFQLFLIHRIGWERLLLSLVRPPERRNNLPDRLTRGRRGVWPR